MIERDSQEKRAVSDLLNYIPTITDRLNQEMQRTGQSWVVCFGSPIQVLSAEINVIGQSGQLTAEAFAVLEERFDQILTLWRQRKQEEVQTGEDISDEAKQELLNLVEGLRQIL